MLVMAGIISWIISRPKEAAAISMPRGMPSTNWHIATTVGKWFSSWKGAGVRAARSANRRTLSFCSASAEASVGVSRPPSGNAKLAASGSVVRDVVSKWMLSLAAKSSSMRSAATVRNCSIVSKINRRFFSARRPNNCGQRLPSLWKISPMACPTSVATSSRILCGAPFSISSSETNQMPSVNGGCSCAWSCRPAANARLVLPMPPTPIMQTNGYSGLVR